MKALGTDIGTIHFVGIGGIGMSGIAEVMHQLGYKVQGSDIAEGYIVEGLRKLGIPIMIGQKAENLGDAAVIVISSAVSRGNPEVEAAVERRLPIVKRAEMLAELMRMQKTIAVAGTHGKTTTTSMVAAMLDAGGLDPTVINGGIINRYGSNARLGKSDWMVVEADESDGSFLRLDGTIAVVTNIDPEHLEHYGGFEEVKKAYCEFIENVPFYGLAVMCVDHPEVQNVIGRIRDRRIVTYGFSALADLRADNVMSGPGVSMFDAIVLERDGARRTIEGISVPDARAAQCAECAGRDRRGAGARHVRGPDPRRLRPLRRREAAVQQGRRDRRRRDHRRLRSSSGRNPRGAFGGPGERRPARDRRRAAASLHAPPRPDGGLPERVQRRRHRVRDAGLCGGRAADRRRGRGSVGRRAARPWPPNGADRCRPRRPLPAPCAISPPRATSSSAWAPATSRNGRAALADGVCSGARASK